jgi:high-affinity K+ transport system ATPase subunit B
MQEKGKEYIKFKLATCFRTILKNKKNIDLENKANNIEDLRLVASMRQLEAESGLSYTIIQNVFVGKRDIQFTSLITLIENLGISFSEFAEIYDAATEKQMADEKKEIEENKTKRKTKKSKKVRGKEV